MKTFRTVLFWLHLAAGTVAGVVVLIMSVTGVLLMYEKQIRRLGRHAVLPGRSGVTRRVAAAGRGAADARPRAAPERVAGNGRAQV